MRNALLVLVLLLPTPVLAQDEDEAHRQDRVRTEQLNREASRASQWRTTPDAVAERDYRKAQANYERRMAAWRRQVAACRAGEWSACE